MALKILLSLVVCLISCTDLSESRITLYNVPPPIPEDPSVLADAVSKIKEVKAPLKQSKSLGNSKMEWILSYQGEPFDISILYVLSMTLVMAKLAKVIFRRWQPVFSNFEQPELPLIPLVVLQASRAERDVQGQPRNGLQWFGEKFLIHANAEFIDIEDASAKAKGLDDEDRKEVIEEVNKLPAWSLVRGLLPFMSWTTDTRKRVKRIKTGRLLSTGIESIYAEREEELRYKLTAPRQQRVSDIYDLKDFYTIFKPKLYRSKRKEWMSDLELIEKEEEHEGMEYVEYVQTKCTHQTTKIRLPEVEETKETETESAMDESEDGRDTDLEDDDLGQNRRDTLISTTSGGSDARVDV